MLNLNPADFKPLVWKKEYESGHPLMDEQHRRLFAEVNELLAALRENRPKAEIGVLIEKLFADTREHFGTEEALLSEAGYDETPVHALIHKQLLQKGARLVARFEENRLDFSEIFLYLAKDIVMDHILKIDIKYFGQLDWATVPATWQTRH